MATFYCIGGPMDGQPVEVNKALSHLEIEDPTTRKQVMYARQRHVTTAPTGAPETSVFYVMAGMDPDESHARASELNEALRKHGIRSEST